MLVIWLIAYILERKSRKPQFSLLDDDTIYEMLNLSRNHIPTLASIMNFGIYPQGLFPQLCITAISVPGYEGITLKADSLEQTVALSNPPQNTCYFVITLSLEDGTQLWQSDYIKPGETSSPIVLTQSLEKGTYPNTVLQYSCFKMDDEKTPLNGAETKLTLRVK